MRKVALFAASTFLLAFAFGVGPAHAVDAHYTDGTQCDGGPFCSFPSFPPPTDPVWAEGQECHIDIVDPPTFTFMTEHVVYGTTPPPAGVVPVVDDASITFPYEGVAPALFPIDVTSIVAGHRGFRADTWNIGKGVTAWVPFDCTGSTTSTTSTTSTSSTTSPSSTSTTTTVEPATTSTTNTTVASAGSTVSTTTTLASAGSTVSTTSTSALIGTDAVTPGGGSAGTLPFTGSGTWPLAGLGVALALSGVAAVAARRVGSRGT